LTQARELLRLVDRPEEYEIVRISHGESSDAPLLGYDVGYWGGGNYSILCAAGYSQHAVKDAMANAVTAARCSG